ncbi:kinase-like protein [Annulohypoxylon truncatum]|uniref:kinase-like protein n=1 Tax=Annulohypoxylon truncatum TaxID=327061 RepID=UPI0020081F24|nr:kinase-like protein [Annulohypoxylon truncatum]KAI1207563.1 kinase-like protein [Annulohypoxylon truncatum]
MEPEHLISLAPSDDENETGGKRAYPNNYEEQCQLTALQFEEWRRTGARVRWREDDIHKYRKKWQNKKIPRSGLPRFWDGASDERQPWSKQLFYIGSNVSLPDLDNPWSASDPRIERVKKSYKDAKNYFAQTDRFYFQKALGFGGLGLALHYRYEGVEPVKDVVVKLSLRGWIAEDIRREENAAKAMAGAAHCIQLIDKPTVGFKETKYKPEPDDMDSSEEDESSGDDSMDEGSARPPRKPRSAMTEEELAAKKRRRDDREADADSDLVIMGDSATKDFMLLEYVEGGSLVHLIDKLQQKEKATGQRVAIPNRVLWALWLCMIRACVALKYPPRKFHPGRRTGYRPQGQTDLIEIIPPQSKRWRKKNWVHFDIDPSNIFIGNLEIPLEEMGGKRKRADEAQPDRDSVEHNFVPKLKLADFGLMREIKPYKRNIYYSVRRKTGKNTFFAPEQFAAEWDRIPPTKDGGEVGEQRIAGNYGSPMNVYQMALSMWVVITQLSPPLPVQPQPPAGLNPKRNKKGLIPSYLDQFVDPTDPETRISYCPLLMDPARSTYDYVDIELRTAIYECMYHRQDDRPTVERLLEQARKGANKIFSGETDASVKEWVDEFLFNAPSDSGDDQRAEPKSNSLLG